MRRELRAVDDETYAGAVDDNGIFEDDAADVFGRLRDELGDEQAAATLIRDGWSNGYLYLTSAGEVSRAAGHDVTPGHDQLHHYWTRGEGLARWLKSTHQFETLRDLLAEHVPVEQADRMAAAWVHEVTGNWPSSDAHRVAEGGKPRGDRIGPG